MKWVHVSDLHVDSPLTGLEAYPGMPTELVRLAPRRAVEGLIELCLNERADFLLIVGDLFDQSWKDYASGLHLAAELNRLEQSGTHVIWLRGYHDASSSIVQQLTFPDHVHELAVRRPETILLEDLGVALHGRGSAQAEVTENWVASYPEPQAGVINIGMLYTSLDGELGAGMGAYAPCMLEQLREKGYQYWALGGRHTRAVLSETPWVIYPGNLQGRHIAELGPKGATLVKVADDGALSVEFRELGVIRWRDLLVDAEGAASVDAVLDRAQQTLQTLLDGSADRLQAVRLHITGACAAHVALCERPRQFIENLRSRATDLADETLLIERVLLETRDANVGTSPLTAAGAIGYLAAAFAALKDDPERLQEFAVEFEELQAKLPPELALGPEPFTLDAVTYRSSIERIENTLLPRLLERGEKK